MLSIMICCFLICKITAMNENKRRNDNNEEFIIDKRFEYNIFESNSVQETTTKDYDEYINYDFVKMCQKSCTSGLSTKHNVHKEIDKEVVEHILQFSDCPYSEEFSTESSSLSNLDSQVNLHFLELDIEPSITTLYTEYTAMAKYIVHQNIEDLDFIECNPLHNSKFSPNFYEFNQSETYLDEETLSAFTSDSDSSLSELNIGSIINKLSTKEDTAEETSNAVASSSKFNKTIKENMPDSLICSYTVEEIYKKIKTHIELIFRKSKSYIKWYAERLNVTYYMIKELHTFKCSNNNSYEEFIVLLDGYILKLLDAINLRKHSTLLIYNLNDFPLFNQVLMKFIFDLNLYALIGQKNLKYQKEKLPILCVEYVKLFKFFPIFPELITLGSLFNTELDYKMLLYVRIINLMCEENILRIQQIRYFILFIIKKLFLGAKRRSRELDITSDIKFNSTEYFEVKSICKNNHSNLTFFIWEIHSDKVRRIKKKIEEKNGYNYDITIYNIDHFRAVFGIFLLQHIMFLKYHNFRYEQFKELLESSFKSENCVFCLFLSYLELIKSEVLTLRK